MRTKSIVIASAVAAALLACPGSRRNLMAEPAPAASATVNSNVNQANAAI